MKLLHVSCLLALLAPALLQAQGAQEDRCNTFVEKHCGTRAPAECFAADDAWEAVPETCTAHIQTMIEMEREALEQQAEEAALDRPGLSDRLGQAYGRSYGGVLRKGPGTGHAKLASLAQGDRIRLLEHTGVAFDGYDWYRVMTSHGEGFHWGGIFCSDGPEPARGVLTVCGSEREAALFGGDEAAPAGD